MTAGIKTHRTRATSSSKTLDRLRKKIDRSDRKLLEALAARFGIVREIGAIKRERGLEVEDPGRWSKIVATRKAHGKSLELRGKLIEEIFGLIHRESLELQNALPPSSKGQKKQGRKKR